MLGDDGRVARAETTRRCQISGRSAGTAVAPSTAAGPGFMGRVIMSLPFTRDQFFDVFAAYNASLWPFALALWLLTVGAVAMLARDRPGAARIFSLLLAIQWAWAALAYHAAFFSAINPAAWFFAALFLIEAGLLAWMGALRNTLHLSRARSPRHYLSWALVGYALLYPGIVWAPPPNAPLNGASGVTSPMIPNVPPAAAMLAIFRLNEQEPRSTSTMRPASSPAAYGLAPSASAQPRRLPPAGG